MFLCLCENNRIFGTFIKAKIEVKHNGYIYDKDAFVFSLNNNKIYNNSIPDYSLRFHNDYPLKIGNNAQSNGFWLWQGNIEDTGLLKNPKAYDFQKNNELTDGHAKFLNLEIFEI